MQRLCHTEAKRIHCEYVCGQALVPNSPTTIVLHEREIECSPQAHVVCWGDKVESEIESHCKHWTARLEMGNPFESMLFECCIKYEKI